MKQRKDDRADLDSRDFASIARALGVCVNTVQDDYFSAIRKIRYYLLKHKDKRDELYEGLADLVNGAEAPKYSKNFKKRGHKIDD